MLFLRCWKQTTKLVSMMSCITLKEYFVTSRDNKQFKLGHLLSASDSDKNYWKLFNTLKWV